MSRTSSVRDFDVFKLRPLPPDEWTLLPPSSPGDSPLRPRDFFLAEEPGVSDVAELSLRRVFLGVSGSLPLESDWLPEADPDSDWLADPEPEADWLSLASESSSADLDASLNRFKINDLLLS